MQLFFLTLRCAAVPLCAVAHIYPAKPVFIRSFGLVDQEPGATGPTPITLATWPKK